MAFRFKKATCVAAGTFNMYIIQPAWLAKLGILPPDIEITIASNLDEPGFQFSSPKLPVRWLVSPNRIEVESEGAFEDCGEKVARVLGALPWTPLAALGNNAIYSAPRRDLDQLPAAFRSVPDTPASYELAQQSFHLGLLRNQRLINLQLSISHEELTLSVNVHTELRGRESVAGQTAARQFLQDRTEAESLIPQLFKASICHDHANAKSA